MNPRKWTMGHGVAGALLLSVVWGLGPDSLHWQWMARWCVTLLFLVLAFSVTRTWSAPWVGVTLGVPALYVLGSALVSAFWFPRHMDEAFEVGSSVRQGALMGGAVVAVFALSLGKLRVDAVIPSARSPLRLVGVAWALVAAGVLLAPEPHYRVFFIENPSLAGGFLVTAACLYHRKLWAAQYGVRGVVVARALLWGVTLFALLRMGATTPLLALLAAGAGFSVTRRTWWVLPLAGVAVASALLFFPLESLLNDSGRFHLWRLGYEGWLLAPGPWNQIFGLGVGSTRVFLPLWQVASGAAPEHATWFFWLHNDWLQLLLELGVVGVGLVLLLFWDLVRRSFSRPPVLAAVLSYAAAMGTNFPLHWAPTAVLGMIVVFEVYGGVRDGDS